MKWRNSLLALVLSAALVLPAPAGFIFKKKQPQASPSDRVGQLIGTLKTDQDESKREAAAVDLRHFDPKTYPEVVPVLIEALQNDPRPAVRVEAAQSLGRLRPVSQQAGWALEQAAAKDSSTRVRLQARSSLLYYRVSGYRSDARPEETTAVAPPRTAPSPSPAVPSSPQTRTTFSPKETPPPPLAPPLPPRSGPQPLPQGPAQAPHLQPVPQPPDQGPELIPPE
jgi:hypothetical protein